MSKLEDLEALSRMLDEGKINRDEYERLKRELLEEPESEPNNPMAGKPPGWYDDPSGKATHQAYWDGEQWSGSTRTRFQANVSEGKVREADSRPFYRRGGFIAIGALILFVVIAAISTNLAGNEVEETFQDISAGLDDDSSDNGTDVADSATGDWPSRDAYIEDIVDTSDKMGTLLSTVSDMSTDVANGQMTLSQYAQLMTTAIESAESHRDYFRGTTPPDGYEDSHRFMINALETYVDSFDTAQRGAETGNIDLINEAADLMGDATQEIEKATAALP